MQKDYKKWTPVKMTANNEANVRPNYKEGGIYWVLVGDNVGMEQDGKGELFARPVVVVRGFSKELFWGIPLTSQNKSGKYYFSFTFLANQHSVAILSQLRAFDTSRISGRIMGRMKKEDLLKLKNRLKCLL